MTNDLNWDFDDPTPKPPDDLHTRMNESQAEREESERRRKERELARPTAINSSVAEEKRLAADPETPLERKRLAIACIKTYSAAYAEMSANPEPALATHEWAHFEASLAVLREHEVFLGLEP